MDKAGSLWTEKEDSQLKMLYIKYKMDISEISEIHGRSIQAIQCRIVKLGLIPENIIWKKLTEKYGSLPFDNQIKALCDILSDTLK